MSVPPLPSFGSSRRVAGASLSRRNTATSRFWRRYRVLLLVLAGLLVFSGAFLATSLLHKRTGTSTVTPAIPPLTPQAATPVATTLPLPPPPAPLDPFLKVAGIEMRNQRGSGEVVPLRGVNLGSWLILEHWMSPLDRGGIKDHWTGLKTLEDRFGLAEAERLFDLFYDTWIQDGDFDRIADLGMNVVRIPIWYRTLQHEDGTWKKDAFQRLDAAVASAWKRGIYTILDLHGPDAQQRANAHCTGRIVPKALLWSDPAGQQRMIALWEGIAAHYVGNPAIAGYDLLNEPMDVPSTAVMADLLGRCYTAIRAKDPDHTLIMEATFHRWNLSMLPDPRTRGWTNVAYQYHVYPWGAWNDAEGIKRHTEGTIKDWLDHAAWGVAGQIGEFNMGNKEGWDHAVRSYSKAGMSWMMWSYKSANNSTWGLFLPEGKSQIKPDLHTDSAAQIAAAWQSWGLEHFRLNPMVGAAVAMPVAVDESYDARPGETLMVAAPGVLANDRRLVVEGPPVTLKAVLVDRPQHGVVALEDNGSFRYAPTVGFRGYDRFTYRVSDGRTSSVRLAHCRLKVDQ